MGVQTGIIQSCSTKVCVFLFFSVIWAFIVCEILGILPFGPQAVIWIENTTEV